MVYLQISARIVVDIRRFLEKIVKIILYVIFFLLIIDILRKYHELIIRSVFIVTRIIRRI